MNGGFYGKTARNNVRQNYRFFIPRILSETGLAACFYIALTLTLDDRLHEVRGGSYIPSFMLIGLIVLVLLSTVLTFYTNSFLMKQRKREFGLYNVLGMEKRHVGKVLFRESLICSLTSVIAGLFLGTLFYKLCSLLICRLLHAEILVGFDFIKPLTLLGTGAFFLLLDFVTYLYNRVRIARMKPVELLQSKSAGEKEPRVKWLLLVLGVLSLGAGYYLALATKNPLKALALFLVAVLLVIIGTYFLFVSGSIFVLKLLKSSESYYYTRRRMPAVSGLLYRMKQNAVGLASITILATAVLVMVSTTVSLYSGYQYTLEKAYPQHLYLSAWYETEEETVYVPEEELETAVRAAAEKNGLEIASVDSNSYLSVAYLLENNTLLTQDEAESSASFSNIATFVFITEDTYHALTGDTLPLEGNEIAVCTISSAQKTRPLTGDLTIRGNRYPIRNNLPVFPISIQVLASTFNAYGIVVSDAAVLDEIYLNQRDAYGKYASDYTNRIAVSFRDPEKAKAVGDAFGRDVSLRLTRWVEERSGSEAHSEQYDTLWGAEESLLGMYGTLLFLGILLGTVCCFATVLIIYYKQISEGYEDRERFQIMEKVGMSRSEVRRTINSQVLLVFFLPLLVAGIHLLFASPMLIGMMMVMSLFSVRRYVVCSLVTYAVFAVIYTLIYRGTSKTYYKIVR